MKRRTNRVPSSCWEQQRTGKVWQRLGAATGGETIYIKNGEYYEDPIPLQNQLTITGESQDGVIIHSRGNSNLFKNNSLGYSSIVISNLTIKDISLTGNYIPIQIGGDGDVTIKNCTFDNCESQYGAMRISTTGSVTIDNCKFLNTKSSTNSSSGSSAIDFSGSSSTSNYTITNTVIDGSSISSTNTSANIYGAIYNERTGGTVTLDNVTIRNCNLDKASGLIATKGNMIIKNSTFVDNYVYRNPSSGGFIYATNSATVTIETSLIQNNTQPCFFLSGISSTSFNLNYNNIQGNTFHKAFTNSKGSYTLEANYWGSDELPDGITASTWIVDDDGELKLNTGDPLEKDVPIIPYIDADGNTANCTIFTVIDGSETTLGTEGETTWYVVKNSNTDASVNNGADAVFTGTLTLNGDVNIILCDGAEMSVTCDDDDGIVNNGTLTIYSQSTGDGKLTVSSATGTGIYINGSTTINGGIITVSSFATADDGVVTVGKNFLAYIDDDAIAAGTASAIVAAGEVSEDVLSIIGGKTLVPFDHNVVTISDSDITVNGHAVADADFTLDEDGDGTDEAYCFVADEGDELTLGYTGDVSDDEIVVYTVRDADYNDITASVLSGSTLTMPAGNVTVRASIADLSGFCGTDGHEEEVTWSYDPATTKTLTISGTGGMGSNPWAKKLKNVITKVVIGDGVTDIRKEAFEAHIALTDVTIGSGVETIGNYAFDGCTALTGVTIPDGVTTINKGAFKDCSSLTSIDIPNSVTKMNANIFKDCTSLTTVSIGSGLKKIGGKSFNGCTSLTGITVDAANKHFKNDERGALLSKNGKNFIVYPAGNIATSYDIPYGVNTIEDCAFEGCTALTALTIPYGVTSINSYAFEGCSGLTSIIIPASVTNIEWDAFLGCTGMTDVYCYVTDPSALDWEDEGCDDFMGDKENTTCHVFDKDAFDAKWATDGDDDICVTFVGDLETIPFNLIESEGVSHLEALAGKTLPVQFSRTYTTGSGANKASTVCLPFDFDKPDTETVGTFYTFGGVSADYVVTMNEVPNATTTLTAGTPYMFLPKANGPLTQGNAAFTVPDEGFEDASSATEGSWQFKGTFEKITWPSGQTNLYGFAGKEYTLSSGDKIDADDIGSFRRFDYGTCAAFRCYLLAPESSGARGVSKAASLPETLKVRLVKADGTTTAIGTLDTRTGEVTFGDEWYDLNGRRLDAQPTQKGVYINNGKKIVIKN